LVLLPLALVPSMAMTMGWLGFGGTGGAW
jgi:hypothetical protein